MQSRIAKHTHSTHTPSGQPIAVCAPPSLHHRLKPLTIALLCALAVPTAHAAGTFSGLGFLDGGSFSSANAVNAAGNVVVGYSNNGNNTEAPRWVQDSSGSVSGGTMTGLGFLNGGSYSYASGVNAAGNVVVGYGDNSISNNVAFRWVQDSPGSTTGHMTALGFLGTGSASYAYAVNAAGNVVVGYGYNGTNNVAFRWVQDNSGSASGGTMTGLGVLSVGTNSYANAVNAAGNVVVGYGYNGSGNSEAFRWVEDSSGSASGGTMTGLGFLSGGSHSIATAVNAAGNVVVGYGGNSSGNIEAFRWVQDNSGSLSGGTMTGLGVLSGGSFSIANAVNAAGNVVVGYGGNSSGNIEAFRWAQDNSGSGGTMQSVADWLHHAGVSTTGFTRLTAANGVSADGNTVVGSGIDSNSNTQAYIANVKGIVGLTDLGQSVAQTLAVSSQMEGLTSLSMNGAHHRTLMDNAMSDGENCGWVSGDLGRVYRQANGYTGMAEVGACHDLAERAVRVGLGVGSSYSDLDLANSGHSRLNGQYGVAEIDWQLPNAPLVASLLGTYGIWDATLKRGYAIAGTQPSQGDTNVTTYGLRARLDWTDAFHLGQVSFSPRVAYTVTRSEVNAYQETGGSAPASFGDQNHTSNEARLGLTGKYALNDKTTLLGHGEVVHRFDDRGATINASVNALGIGLGFSQAGNLVAQDWVRLGAEVDYQINARNRINASSFVATAGQDADITAALSWNVLF